MNRKKNQLTKFMIYSWKKISPQNSKIMIILQHNKGPNEKPTGNIRLNEVVVRGQGEMESFLLKIWYKAGTDILATHIQQSI